MKRFTLFCFLRIAYTFSKNNEPTLLDTSLDSLDLIGKDKVLTLLLGKEAISDQCVPKLQEYCKNLKNMALEPKNVHPALGGLCGNEDEECNNYKNRINTILTGIKESLMRIYEKLNTDGSTLDQNECNYSYFRCFFFWHFPDFLTICNLIIEKCYEKMSQHLAYKVLFKSLTGNLKNQTTCEINLKEPCSKFSTESYYLAWYCFWKRTTCMTLIKKAQDNCKALNNSIENALKDHTLEKQCHSLLQRCYIHFPDCEETLNCENFKKRCEEKGITYSPFHDGLFFDPIGLPPTLEKRIGFQQIFAKAAATGILVSKPTITKSYRFLLLSLHNKQISAVAGCVYYLNRCAFKQLSEELANMCNATNIVEICVELSKQVPEECNSLELALKNKGLFNMSATDKSDLYTLHGLSKIVPEEDYASLVLDCYHLESLCNQSIMDSCNNLRQVYHRSQFYNIAKDKLEKELFGLFRNLSSSGVKECAVKLTQKCQIARNNTIDILALCLKPEEACKIFAEDVKRKSLHLRHVLDKVRDYPQEKDCLVLEEKCEDLTKDFEELNGPCTTLKRNCAHLRNAKKLKDSLLSKNADILANVDNCTAYLNMKCPRWLKRETNLFNLICIEHHKSCIIMTEDMQNHCSAFKENMKSQDVVKKSEDSEKRGDICFFWGGYCEMFMKSCPHKLEQNDTDINGLCAELKKNCRTFYKKELLLKDLMYIMKGFLTDKNVCSKQLSSYCSNSTQSNKTLKNLCIEYKDEKDKTCDRLVNRTKIFCNIFLIRLDKTSSDLENRAYEFKKIKKQAVKAVSDSGLLLAIPQTKDKQNHYPTNTHSNITAYIRLMRRKNILNLQPSIRQGLAFDLMSLVIELYLEAKGICDHFIRMCVFENDCPKFKDSCKKIHNYCKEFELPKATPFVTTSISTITMTESIITGKGCMVYHVRTSLVMHKSASTKTKINTLVATVTQKCNPVPCIMEKETQTKKVKPSGETSNKILNKGIKISGLGIINIIIIWIVGIFAII
ncbi:uncharacterized protein T551_01854 [Pneumocystis jirovecii RU7]|uniref:Major surface glycoprotein 2 C-terminal domain-containing protein n=1 Tax=Pneumocystis jirovecii (strain RU7) TaxID=1408657 RepID=A0A0W4ZQB7_PNEJ7|nr:uncharacterized protein T551_01854 [Pneumocystis jirovecii RU7]KTW30571.1 hypothetical protein T551_01854 [Pneumocystis jirovecii RU7]